MKHLLMNAFVDIVLPILLLIIIIALAVFINKKLQKKFNKPLEKKITMSEKPQVKLHQSYCTEQEMKFLEALHKALPRECISFPNVGVSKLIEPKGNMNDYNCIVDKYVDVCVFLRKDMSPILVIDLFEPSPAAQQLKKFDDSTNKVLKALKIPVLHKQIQNKYNLDELLVEVLNSLNSTTVAYLNSKNMDNIVKK